MNDRLQALSAAGVSIWLDDLSRERLETGNLADLVRNRSVVGVTTNPTIFASALAEGERYNAQVSELVATGADVDTVIHELTTADVRTACDVLAPVHAADPYDGRVSIEVEPGLAMDGEGTVAQARQLWSSIDRPNLMVKIPATRPGLAAITDTIAEGISVNVTLIFSLERYREVMDAYLAGLERAAERGIDVSTIHSVASFFVSRVDSEVDKRLEAVGTDAALALRGKAALANARLAHAAHREVFGSERFRALRGANLQRPLWASTGVKDPAYPDTLYVAELVVEGCVNTMPEKTLDAFADHGEVVGDTVTARASESEAVLAALAEVGIDFADVLDQLEREGVEKFVVSWAELVDTVTEQMAGA